MTTYVALNGTPVYNRAKYKPHDKTIVRVAKATHNAAANAVASASVVNMITIPANSVILGVWGQVAVDSAAPNVELDIGLSNAGGQEYGAKVETNVAAGTVTGECLDNATFTASETIIGLEASNSLAWNTGAYTVIAAWIELDSITALN